MISIGHGARCARCGSVLRPGGTCPGTAPLLVVDGREYGTAAQLVHRLGTDITTAMIRNWSRRDGLLGYRIAGAVHYWHGQAALIERDKRLNKRRGRPRPLDTAGLAA